ncbi:MAG TPA: DUF72 domain-containing protein [Candidatus Moranbacteria bacterium]|nr:DUF72 domain-containing protein [Candidatus Moranbacteria bacterium]
MSCINSMPLKKKIYAGTSGWVYKDWGERFYPKNLNEDHLTYFSKEFKTVEINSSFYHLPTVRTFGIWKNNSSKNFIFSVKINQYITHRKRLILDEGSKRYLRIFLKNAQKLERKLAVILIQLPPNFKKNTERLESFFEFYRRQIDKLKYRPLTAIEFRHESWFNDEAYKILEKYKIALVISSAPEYRREVFTTDFVYIRMHGSEKHYAKYLNKDLEKLKNEIGNYPKNIKKIFVYFNNDYSAYAIENARYLKALFEHK